MLALMSGVPYSQTFLGTGAVVGNPVAIPVKSGRGMNPAITVQITFGANPGNYVFAPEVSEDAVNWFPLTTLTGTDASVKMENYEDFSNLFFRLSQTSKTNSVTATALITLH